MVKKSWSISEFIFEKHRFTMFITVTGKIDSMKIDLYDHTIGRHLK